MDFLRIFLMICILHLVGGAWAYDLGSDKELDLKAVETITADAALNLVGGFSYSGNEYLRYWNTFEVDSFVGFETSVRCIPVDCTGRYNIDLITSYGVKGSFITSFSWKEKTSRLVNRLQAVLAEAKKRRVGVIFKQDTLVYFVQ